MSSIIISPPNERNCLQADEIKLWALSGLTTGAACENPLGAPELSEIFDFFNVYYELLQYMIQKWISSIHT